MITDSIADCFSRLRNSAKARQEVVVMPYSKLNESILNLLKAEGFVGNVSVDSTAKRKTLVVRLRYEAGHKPVLEHIKRISKPGHRVYGRTPDGKGVREGLGFRILTTSKGVMSDRQAAEKKVGGEIIGEVW